MHRRTPARYLAPLALVAATVAVIAIASSGGGSGTSEATTPAATTSTTRAGGGGATRRRTSYTVRSGDVLSAIAERFGVTVERLQELNPDLDPQALVPGDKLRLRR